MQLIHMKVIGIIEDKLVSEKTIGGSFTTAAYVPETNSVKTTNPNLNK